MAAKTATRAKKVTVESPYDKDKIWKLALDKNTVAISGEGKNKNWIQIESVTPILKYAENLIAWFMEDVLGEAIAFPLTVNTKEMGKKSQSVHGHFEIEPNWATREGLPVWAVVLVAENLARDPREVITTILHEAIHVFNFSRGDKDASKSGRHNQTFRDAAEGAGLVVAKHSKYGYVTDGISDELWLKIEQHMPPNAENFNLFANAFVPKEPKESKTKAWKCECEPGFKLRVPAKQTLDSTCNVCDAAWAVVE